VGWAPERSGSRRELAADRAVTGACRRWDLAVLAPVTAGCRRARRAAVRSRLGSGGRWGGLGSLRRPLRGRGARVGCRLEQLGDPEVEELDRARGRQDCVCGLDIAVHDAALVRSGESAGYAEADVEREIGGDWPRDSV
jgi:hypothetical protein